MIDGVITMMIPRGRVSNLQLLLQRPSSKDGALTSRAARTRRRSRAAMLAGRMLLSNPLVQYGRNQAYLCIYIHTGRVLEASSRDNMWSCGALIKGPDQFEQRLEIV